MAQFRPNPTWNTRISHTDQGTWNHSCWQSILSWSTGPTEHISIFVDSSLQPIEQKQQSYIKDTTHFINFNKNILLPEEAIWVLLTFVLSTLTFPKRRELISSANIMKSIIVKISHHNKILGDLKRLLLKENFFNDKDKHYLETFGIAIGTKKW